MAQTEYRSHPAYWSSLALHGAIVGAIVVAGLMFSQSRQAAPQVFELVAGQGDNYMATQATALGAEDGVKFDAPEVPAPPEPQGDHALHPPETAPLEAVPPAKLTPMKHAASAKDLATGAVNFRKALQHAQIVGESRIKMREIRERREREKQARLAAQAAARKAGVSYEAFLRQQAAKGRAGGVVHGTSMEAGAGGKALTAEQQDAMAAWAELLRERWRDSFVPPADFTESMVAHVKWVVGADGSISRVHITHSTGNAAFNDAVIDALQHISIPPPPSHRGDDYEADFSLKNEE